MILRSQIDEDWMKNEKILQTFYAELLLEPKKCVPERTSCITFAFKKSSTDKQLRLTAFDSFEQLLTPFKIFYHITVDEILHMTACILQLMTACPWQLITTCLWQLMTASLWQHLLTFFDIFWQLLKPFDSFWQLKTALNSFWHNCFWQLLTAFDSFDTFWHLFTYLTILQLMTVAHDSLHITMHITNDDSLPITADDSFPVTANDSLPMTANDSLPMTTDDSLPVTAEGSLPMTGYDSLSTTAVITVISCHKLS